MALDPSNSSNLEQLALKGLTHNTKDEFQCKARNAQSKGKTYYYIVAVYFLLSFVAVF